MVVQKTRINHQIRASEVRVIDESGKMVGVMKTSEALKLAQELELDLVEVSSSSQPPVAKLLNFDKFRYQQKKLAQEAKKKIKEVKVKGIRLSVRIGQHDLEFKVKKASEFLGEGHKVKVDTVMRGREQAHPNLAYDLLKKFQELLITPFVIETGPTRMGGTVSVILAPRK